jgi:hypothetical protein
MKTKKISYQEGFELAGLLKTLALMTNNENLIVTDKISELPENITKLLNVLTNNYEWDKHDSYAKAMASVIISEIIPGLTADELMDSDNISFNEKYQKNFKKMYKLEIIKKEAVKE